MISTWCHKVCWWWLMQIDGWIAMPSLAATPGPSSEPLTRPTCCGLIAAIESRDMLHAQHYPQGSILFTGIDTLRNMMQHVYCRSFSDCWCMYFARSLSNTFHSAGQCQSIRESLYEPWIITWSLVMIAVTSMRNSATSKQIIMQFAHEKC